MLRNDVTLTKKHLGWLLFAGGVLAFVGILSIDLLDVGREGGIGPAQQMALAASAVMALVGLTLIPLGDAAA